MEFAWAPMQPTDVAFCMGTHANPSVAAKVKATLESNLGGILAHKARLDGMVRIAGMLSGS